MNRREETIHQLLSILRIVAVLSAIMLAIWGYNQVHQRRVRAGTQPVRPIKP